MHMSESDKEIKVDKSDEGDGANLICERVSAPRPLFILFDGHLHACLPHGSKHLPPLSRRPAPARWGVVVLPRDVTAIHKALPPV